MRVFVVAALGLSVAVGGCAPTAGSGDGRTGERPVRQCFNVQQIDNFRSGRFDQLFLRVSRNQVYELSVAGGCRDLDFAMRMALIPDGGGSVGSRLCTGDWARVVVPGDASPVETCRVRINRRLTGAEIEALPPAHRP